MVAATFSRCLVAFINPNLYGNCNFRNQYTELEANYINFNSYQQPQTLRDFRRPEDMSFWNELIHEIVEETATPPPWFPYHEYKGFQAATWSLLAFLLLFILMVIVLCAMICLKKREETRSLKLLRARDREFEQRYRNEQ
jgi:lipopolysaccharide export LptBFGC system permease protein LptF